MKRVSSADRTQDVSPGQLHISEQAEQHVDVAKIEAELAEFDRLAAEIAAVWPKGVSAVDAVRDVRREL